MVQLKGHSVQFSSKSQLPYPDFLQLGFERTNVSISLGRLPNFDQQPKFIDNMFKSVMALFLCLGMVGNTLFAQLPGMMSPPDFDAEKAAGITKYDIKKVLKKLKIEDQSTEESVISLLTVYNTEMEEISMNHATTFRELDAAFDQNIQVAMQRRDQSVMNGFKNQLQEILPPIRQEVMEKENQLNETLKDVLTEKQNEKWLKYQKQQKEDSFNFPRT